MTAAEFGYLIGTLIVPTILLGSFSLIVWVMCRKKK